MCETISVHGALGGYQCSVSILGQVSVAIDTHRLARKSDRSTFTELVLVKEYS